MIDLGFKDGQCIVSWNSLNRSRMNPIYQENGRANVIQRSQSSPVDSRPQWALPIELSSSMPVRANHSRSIQSTDLNNVPLDQQQQLIDMNEDQWVDYISHEIALVDKDAFVKKKIIFSCPRAIFEVRPRAYCPRIVTIGPLCRKLAPSAMDRCKALCVKEFMDRKGMGLQDLINRAFENVDNLQHIYFGIPDYNIETLKLLLIADVLFIYEFFLFISKDFNGYIDSFVTNQITVSQVLRDLFLIGNQVPISFLKHIAEMAEDELSEDRLLLCIKYVVWRSNPFVKSHPESTNFLDDLEELMQEGSCLDCEHLLECLYTTCVRKPDSSSSHGGFSKPGSRLPSASQLRKVGIRFKVCKGNTAVVRYLKGNLTFELPKLVIYDETEDTLRNLVAYELTSKAGGEFTGYAIIMDSLIDTKDDLLILYKAGVLENHLGSDERLLRMWNEMCINISEGSCERWERMTHAIMMHYRSNWRVMYREFYSMYFSRPWLWLSTIAAIVLLGMSALQTIYTAASYYQM